MTFNTMLMMNNNLQRMDYPLAPTMHNNHRTAQRAQIINQRAVVNFHPSKAINCSPTAAKREIALDILLNSDIKQLTTLAPDQIKTHALPLRILTFNGEWFCKFPKAHKGHDIEVWFTKKDYYPILGWIKGKNKGPTSF